MGILFHLNTPTARAIPSSSLIELKREGTLTRARTGGDGPPIWACPTNS